MVKNHEKVGCSSNIHYLNFQQNAKNKGGVEVSSNSQNSQNSSKLPIIDDLVSKLKPNLPVYFLRPHAIERATKFFLNAFSYSKYQGDILYSVKSNPEEIVLRKLFETGVRHFDVASLAEIELIHSLFGHEAKMYFMHPVKSRESIHEAYFKYGIRDFVLDSTEELRKIVEVTKKADDLGLHMRISVANSNAAFNLSGKFGILPSKSIALARRARLSSKRFGICFHVGSQCMDPIEYRNAVNLVKNIVEKSKVRLDVLDIGGGFPSTYPGMTPQSMQSYFDEIFDAIEQAKFQSEVKLWCEPGRALVAESGSLLVRVEARKEAMLYLNDGTYGGLFDAGFPNFIYPTRAVRIKGKPLSERMKSFGFYGPTCDSLDVMKGPFSLPENISEGDYIEIGQLGAYSRSLRTAFNGFDESLQMQVSDEPLISMFLNEEEVEILEEEAKF
jgi:ornithine decarboxylase